MARYFNRLILICVSILLLLSPAAVSANGGPLYYPAEGYGLLQLDKDSTISLINEKVLFNIVKSDNEYAGRAEITVTYELRNESAEPKNTEVLFLTPSQGALTVTEKGRQLATSQMPEVKPTNWQPVLVDTVTDPVSGNKLQLRPRGTQHRTVVGTHFLLSFESNETKTIVIRYAEEGGMYEKGVINTIHSHLYYLTPAAFWKGEASVELEVQLHAPGGKLSSNLPLEQVSPTQFIATLNQLPDEEWYFSYVFPDRLLFPTNIELNHNLLTLGTALAMTVVAAGAALLWRKSYIFTVSMVGILAFTIYYISKLGGYPFNSIFVTFTNIMVGVGLLFCHAYIRKWIRRRTAEARPS